MDGIEGILPLLGVLSRAECKLYFGDIGMSANIRHFMLQVLRRQMENIYSQISHHRAAILRFLSAKVDSIWDPVLTCNPTTKLFIHGLRQLTLTYSLWLDILKRPIVLTGSLA